MTFISLFHIMVALAMGKRGELSNGSRLGMACLEVTTFDDNQRLTLANKNTGRSCYPVNIRAEIGNQGKQPNEYGSQRKFR